MQTKHTISIVQIDKRIDVIYIDNENVANKYVNNNDCGICSIWEEYRASHNDVYAELKGKDTNIVSIILKLGEVESVYLNNAEKCESDYSILTKDSDKEYGTYKLIHTNKIEGEI